MLTSAADFDVVNFHPRLVEIIESWPADVLADYVRLVGLMLRHGPDLRLPWSRAMGQGLFELRPRGQSLTCRVLYGFASDRTIVIVHAFTKKSRQTPDRDLRLARRRMKEWHRE